MRFKLVSTSNSETVIDGMAVDFQRGKGIGTTMRKRMNHFVIAIWKIHRQVVFI
jgi:hypothetical protein